MTAIRSVVLNLRWDSLQRRSGSNLSFELSSTTSIELDTISFVFKANSATTAFDTYTGTTLTNLDNSGTFVAGTSTTVVISILDDGLGGADWSYSSGGTDVESGNIASFDFSKSFNFVVYGQDDEYTKSIESVTLTAIPEPSPQIS